MTRFFIIFVLAGLILSVIYFEPDAQLFFELAMAFTAAVLFPSLFIKFWIPSASDHVRLYSLSAGFLVTCAMLWAANFGTDIKIANGNELIFLIPGVTDQISNYGIGIFGLSVSFLIVAAMHLADKYKTVPVKDDLENAST